MKKPQPTTCLEEVEEGAPEDPIFPQLRLQALLHAFNVLSPADQKHVIDVASTCAFARGARKTYAGREYAHERRAVAAAIREDIVAARRWMSDMGKLSRRVPASQGVQ